MTGWQPKKELNVELDVVLLVNQYWRLYQDDPNRRDKILALMAKDIIELRAQTDRLKKQRKDGVSSSP